MCDRGGVVCVCGWGWVEIEGIRGSKSAKNKVRMNVCAFYDGK